MLVRIVNHKGGSLIIGTGTDAINKFTPSLEIPYLGV